MGNILLAAVVVFLIAMAVYGFKKGFIRLLFTTVALIVTIILAVVFSGPLSDFITENTKIDDKIQEKVLQYTDEKIEKVVDTAGETAQEAVINTLPLPSLIKNALIDNNITDNYKSVGAVSFSDYIAASLTKVIIKALSFVILFIIITILLRVLFSILNILSKLPLIRTANHLLGTIFGIIQGLIIIWVCCLILTLFSATSWGQSAFEMINDSNFLSFIYNNNYLMKVVTSFFSSL